MALQPRPPRLLRVLIAASALVAIAAVAAVFVATFDRGQQSPEFVSTEGPTLVFAEFGPTADEILVAPADDPGDRTPIQTVPHATGWGLNPAGEVVAGRTAYTVLPPDAAPERDSPAELWLLDVDRAAASRLARDADLLAAPVLRADGRQLAYRRSEESGAQSLVRVDLETRARRVLHTDRSSFGLFPIGFDRAGALLFTRLSVTGTDLYRVLDGSAPELVLHASDEIARDWSVAPGGDAVAFVAPILQAERIVHRAHVVSLDDAERGDTPADTVFGEQYGPTWRTDGALAIGLEDLGGSGSAPMVLHSSDEPVLPAAPGGFDVPLGWSVDGDYLAVRHFSGQNSRSPGVETLVLVGTDATRRSITSDTELIFLGWTGA